MDAAWALPCTAGQEVTEQGTEEEVHKRELQSSKANLSHDSHSQCKSIEPSLNSEWKSYLTESHFGGIFLSTHY